MSKKNVVGYVVASAAAFGLGYVMQPTPQLVPVQVPIIWQVGERAKPQPVPNVYLLGSLPEVFEREPTPHPTDCLVMRWTR